MIIQERTGLTIGYKVSGLPVGYRLGIFTVGLCGGLVI